MEDKNRGLEDYSMFLLDDRWYLYRFHVDFLMGVTPSSRNAPGFNLQFSLSSTLGKHFPNQLTVAPRKMLMCSKLMKKNMHLYINWWPGCPNNHVPLGTSLQRWLAAGRHLLVDLLEDPCAATHVQGLPWWHKGNSKDLPRDTPKTPSHPYNLPYFSSHDPESRKKYGNAMGFVFWGPGGGLSIQYLWRFLDRKTPIISPDKKRPFADLYYERKRYITFLVQDSDRGTLPKAGSEKKGFLQQGSWNDTYPNKGIIYRNCLKMT